jgi:Ca2+-binding EF-hand superfamily protein
MFLTTQ